MDIFVDIRQPDDRLRPCVLPDTGITRKIGVAVFDGFALTEMATIVDLFRSASLTTDSRQRDRVHYEVCLLSAAGGMIASSSSVFVWTENIETVRSTDDFHALFIAGGAGAHGALRDECLIAWLRQTCPRSELVFPIAEGVLLLQAAGFGQAAAGRCDGKRPLEFAQKSLNAGLSIKVVNPPHTTLSLIQESLRTEIAHQIADSLSPPDETQFTSNFRPKPPGSVSEKIRASARWMDANGDRQIAIGDVAQVAAMSERNFLRRFKIEMGITPSDYLLYVRLDTACRLLVNTDLPVDKIARRCGIGSGGRLAKIFRQHLATTPTEYRATKRPWTDSLRWALQPLKGYSS